MRPETGAGATARARTCAGRSVEEVSRAALAELRERRLPGPDDRVGGLTGLEALERVAVGEQGNPLLPPPVHGMEVAQGHGDLQAQRDGTERLADLDLHTLASSALPRETGGCRREVNGRERHTVDLTPGEHRGETPPVQPGCADYIEWRVDAASHGD